MNIRDYSTLHVDYSTLHVDYSTLHVDYSKLHVDYSTLHVDYSTIHVDYSTCRHNNTFIAVLHFSHSRVFNHEQNPYPKITGTWVQDIFFSSQFYQLNVHLQCIWTCLIRVDITKIGIVHKGVYFTTKHVKRVHIRCRCTFYW